jgi:hypothetical protein
MFVAFALGRGFVFHWIFVLLCGALLAGVALLGMRRHLTPAEDGLVAS